MIRVAMSCCFLFLFLIPTVFSAAYIHPTPEDGARISNDTIQFRVYDEEVNINDCELTLNGQTYAMTYADNYCSYVLTGIPIITEYTFQVTYDGGNGVLPIRDFTYYPTRGMVEEVPAASVVSILVAFGLLLGGFFRRKW